MPRRLSRVAPRGCPNFGYEHQLTPRLSAAGDLLWLPYKWGHDHEVFRSLQLAGELRYYFDEASGERLAAGWYLGAYAMYGDFNIGLKRDGDDPSYRRQGWGVSAGVSGGWKHRFSSHWQMNKNLGTPDPGLVRCASASASATCLTADA